MSNLTTHQLAELLLGVARAQNAIIEAMENSKAGFKSDALPPGARNRVAHPQQPRRTASSDFPARLLLQMLGRNGPDVAQVAKNLDALLGAAGRRAARRRRIRST